MVAVNRADDGAAGGMRTIFDSAYTQKQNVSEFIDAIDPRDIPLLSMLGMGSEAGTAVAGADSPERRSKHALLNGTKPASLLNFNSFSNFK